MGEGRRTFENNLELLSKLEVLLIFTHCRYVGYKGEEGRQDLWGEKWGGEEAWGGGVEGVEREGGGVVDDRRERETEKKNYARRASRSEYFGSGSLWLSLAQL